MILRIQTFLIVLLALLATAFAQEPSPAQSQPPPAQEQPAPAEGQTAVFRTGVSDVRVVVQVTEDNQLVKGLTKDDFEVTDNGAPETIVYFGQEKEPLDLLLLLDISGSMRVHIEEMSQKALEALRYLSPGDRVAIMTFGVRTNVHSAWSDNHAEIARELQTAVDDQEKVGYGTAINAAIIDASRYISQDSDPGRHSILIVTDNLGLNYQANDEMAIGHLLHANASLNAIVIGRGIRPRAERTGDNPDFTPADVFKLAEKTGGEAVKAEQKAAAFFPEMIERIRDRYTLAYHEPAEAKPGQFRQIGVKLTAAARAAHPNAILRARSGYYATE
jgi:VWFA-related protein